LFASQIGNQQPMISLNPNDNENPFKGPQAYGISTTPSYSYQSYNTNNSPNGVGTPLDKKDIDASGHLWHEVARKVQTLIKITNKAGRGIPIAPQEVTESIAASNAITTDLLELMKLMNDPNYQRKLSSSISNTPTLGSQPVIYSPPMMSPQMSPVLHSPMNQMYHQNMIATGPNEMYYNGQYMDKQLMGAINPMNPKNGSYSPGKKTPRRRKQRYGETELSCHTCGVTNTPEWRRGPNGAKTLCNACGLAWAKAVKQKDMLAANNTKVAATVIDPIKKVQKRKKELDSNGNNIDSSNNSNIETISNTPPLSSINNNNNNNNININSNNSTTTTTTSTNTQQQQPSIGFPNITQTSPLLMQQQQQQQPSNFKISKPKIAQV